MLSWGSTWVVSCLGPRHYRITLGSAGRMLQKGLLQSKAKESLGFVP